MKIKITGKLEIPVGDITYFDAAFKGLQEEFPECNFNYEVINETTTPN